MKWSPEQDKVLVDVDNWFQTSDQQVYKLFGYAGTGKTTLAKHLAENVHGDVLFGAFTGKAAHVLHQKGCSGARTIHSMIYFSREASRVRLKELERELIELRLGGNPENSLDREEEIETILTDERKKVARPLFELNPDSDVRRASLVVIDECSMVDENMGRDLLYFGTKILVLGDPAQLPPVGGEGFFTGNCEPDTMLTGIHRQARDNPIIEMATRVRNKEPLLLGSYGSSKVVEKIGATAAMEADQILVGKNVTRHSSNARIRSLLGHEGVLPVVGDRLVCLRNHHDRGLLNGAIWDTSQVSIVDEDLMTLSIRPEMGGDELDVEAHTHHFEGRGKELSWWNKKNAEEFDYGYALTVHKAQGSQWDDVVLFDESYCFREDKHRWLYTGLTRAAEKITIVRDV